MSEVKFPQVEVQLTGANGNAFFIMGKVSKAMKKAGIAEEDVTVYTHSCMSGDYTNLLGITAETVTVS